MTPPGWKCVARACAVSLLALGAAGCTKYVVATAPGPAPGRPVRLTFAPSRAVVLVSPIGVSSERANVSELAGQLVRVTDDSIVLVVRSTRGRGAHPEPEAGAVASVARDAGVTLAERVPDKERTVRTAIGVIGLSAIVLGALWALAVAYEQGAK